MHNKKLQVWLPLILSFCMVIGMFVGYRIKGNMPNTGVFFMEKQRPVQEVLDLINRKYVDDENMDSLGTMAIQTILSRLDPHTVYLPVKELKEVNEDLEGIFFGIGIEFNIINDTMNVVNVLAGGPSDKAGLKVGDQFVKVGDTMIAGVNVSAEKLKRLLRGPGGSKANVTILRNKQQQRVEITRGAIPLYSLDAAYIVADSIGYIRLNKFSETTYREFMQSMEKLQKAGLKSLILDLRDNGGGILTEATHIADEFLSGNKMITYTEGAHSPKKEYRCNKEGVFETGELLVLANEGTASASEVLIGALQDWDRARVIGRRTFGKGLVQEQYELSDGSGLRLTVARYYTPLGRSIQKSYSKGAEDYSHDLIDRFKNGEMNFADSIKHTNEKKYTTKSGNTLYGGGGISPDIFVGYDTSAFDRPLMRALVSGTLNRFVYLNYLHNRAFFNKYKTSKDFANNYHVDEATLNRFKEFAKQDSISFNFKNANEKEHLAKQIKVLTASQMFRTEGFYEANNQYDNMMKKALEILKPQAKNFSTK